MENKVFIPTDKVTISLTPNASQYQMDWKENQKVEKICVEEGNEVSLLEIGSPSHPVEYHIAKRAILHLAMATLEDAESSNRKFVIHKDAHVIAACADFSCGNKNDSLLFELQEEGASCLFHLATLATETDKKEFSVSFIHQAPNTTATMNNYGVCEGNSRLVFSGVGHILHGAKRAETHQNAKIMVFYPHCQAFASPILKIDENDIAASHAASVGRVNDDHLFYLTSRGLSEEEAKQLITLGYLKPILPYFDKEIQEEISLCMERRMK